MLNPSSVDVTVYKGMEVAVATRVEPGQSSGRNPLIRTFHLHREAGRDTMGKGGTVAQIGEGV